MASKYPSVTHRVINLLHGVITVLVDAQKKEVITASGKISPASGKTLKVDRNTQQFHRR